MDKQKALNNLKEYENRVNNLVNPELLKHFEEVIYTRILNETREGENYIHYYINLEDLQERYKIQRKDAQKIKNKIMQHLLDKLISHKFNVKPNYMTYGCFNINSIAITL